MAAMIGLAQWGIGALTCISPTAKVTIFFGVELKRQYIFTYYLYYCEYNIARVLLY